MICLRPTTGATITLTVSAESVDIEAGALFRDRAPVCTCDACDETAESVADNLEQTLRDRGRRVEGGLPRRTEALAAHPDPHPRRRRTIQWRPARPGDPREASRRGRRRSRPSPRWLVAGLDAARGAGLTQPRSGGMHPREEAFRARRRAPRVEDRDHGRSLPSRGGMVQAAGWARYGAAAPTPSIRACTAAMRPAARPPDSIPATAPRAVSPRHQTPNSTTGDNVDAATTNTTPTLDPRPAGAVSNHGERHQRTEHGRESERAHRILRTRPG